MSKDKLKVCHICGASRTLRGMPLTGNYCSPVCRDKAYTRPDSHGVGAYGKQGYRLNSDDIKYGGDDV